MEHEGKKVHKRHTHTSQNYPPQTATEGENNSWVEHEGKKVHKRHTKGVVVCNPKRDMRACLNRTLEKSI